MLKRSRDYYHNNVDNIRKNMREKYKNPSEEDKKN